MARIIRLSFLHLSPDGKEMEFLAWSSFTVFKCCPTELLWIGMDTPGVAAEEQIYGNV